MPPGRRAIAISAFLLQGYAFWALWSRSLIWPVIWPKGSLLYIAVTVLYTLGYWMLNAVLTAELLRKTQLESDEKAAQRIQKTLQPETIEPPPGYQLEAFYSPFRAVGGDYFDVIDLTQDRTLIALADVSGKGIAAALLASNIQALVRSMAGTDADVVALAGRINRHLSRYTPSDRFATAVFLLLDRDSGGIEYVNAGHNPPLVGGAGAANFLEATGLPLGLFGGATYEKRVATLAPGETLLLYTDGLTDSIFGDSPQERLRTAVTGDPRRSLSNLHALVDARLVEDDVTVVLMTRTGAAN